MKKRVGFPLLLATIILAVPFGKTPQWEACQSNPTNIARETSQAGWESGFGGPTTCLKLTEEAANGRTCDLFAEDANAAGETEQKLSDFIPAESHRQKSSNPEVIATSHASFETQPQAKAVTVSSLVSKALEDQLQLLTARQAELDRWNRADQTQFAKWFGTTSIEARETIYERIRVLTLLNKEYSIGNFRRAVPSRRGLFAFVKPADPSKIFVDQAFVTAPFDGANSRPGTLTHEMSHFVLAGGTKDFVYGIPNCKQLARRSPPHAMANADNFEFYVENVR